jgi:antitoxin CptB
MLDDDMRRRRIKVRAWRRGLREMDILMGRFVDARVEALPAEALAELETLLDLPDAAVFRWLSGAEPAPAERDTPLLRQIIAFHRHDGPIH